MAVHARLWHRVHLGGFRVLVGHRAHGRTHSHVHLLAVVRASFRPLPGLNINSKVPSFVRFPSIFSLVQVFYWTHMLYIIYWLFLILHGKIFWYFFIVPGCIFVVEYIYKLRPIQQAVHGHVYIKEVNLLPSRVSTRHAILKLSLLLRRAYRFLWKIIFSHKLSYCVR